LALSQHCRRVVDDSMKLNPSSSSTYVKDFPDDLFSPIASTYDGDSDRIRKAHPFLSLFRDGKISHKTGDSPDFFLSDRRVNR
jgi:hypothetical protein